MEKEIYQSMYETETYHFYFRSKYEIVLSVLEHMGLKKDSNAHIVDYGCGCGLMLKYLSQYGEVVGMDFSEEALKYCRRDFLGELEKVDLTLYDGTELYDYGVALDVIEHIEDDQKALRNMCNGMKKGGVCVITVPAFMTLWTEHDKNHMHQRRYNKKELERVVLQSGFEIEFCSYYNFWLFPAIFIVRKIERLFKIKDRGSKLELGFKEGWVNRALYHIFSSEKRRICKEKGFPFGVSIICVARRKK